MGLHVGPRMAFRPRDKYFVGDSEATASMECFWSYFLKCLFTFFNSELVLLKIYELAYMQISKPLNEF